MHQPRACDGDRVSFPKDERVIIDPDELPIADNDGIAIKAFPEDVQPILREIGDEETGHVDINVGKPYPLR